MDHALHYDVVHIFSVAEHLFAHVYAEGPFAYAEGTTVLKRLFYHGVAAQYRRGEIYSLDDFFITGTAADIAADGLFYLRLRRSRAPVYQSFACHHHPRCAESALDGTHRAEGIDECLFFPLAEPLDGDYSLAGRPFRRHYTGTRRLAVHDDRAGTAGALAAAVLYGTQPEIVAQKAQQRLILRGLIDSAVHSKTV